MTARPLRDKLWLKRLTAIEAAWAAAREGDPDAIHQLRVGSRRIREVLPIMGDRDHSHHVRRLKRVRRRIRDLTRTLGPVRERDVSLRLLSALEEEHPADRTAIQLVQQMVAVERKNFNDELVKHLDALPLKKLVRKLTHAIKQPKKSGHHHEDKTTGPPEPHWQTALAIQLARRAKQLLDAADRAGALYAADRLHAVRVAAKKLRYALELGHEARIGRWGTPIRSLKRVQDVLGRMHDCEALLERLRAFDAAQGTPAMAESLGRLTRLLEEDTRRCHASFVHDRPRLLDLCATIRQQALHVIPVEHPAQRVLRVSKDAAVSKRAGAGPAATARRVAAR